MENEIHPIYLLFTLLPYILSSLRSLFSLSLSLSLSLRYLKSEDEYNRLSEDPKKGRLTLNSFFWMQAQNLDGKGVVQDKMQ